MSEQRVNLAEGEAILLDSLGARAIRLQPSGTVALMLDIEGRLNKTEARDVVRYLLSPGAAAELMAALVAAVQRAVQESPEGVDFAVELERALAREQEHLVSDEDEDTRGQRGRADG